MQPAPVRRSRRTLSKGRWRDRLVLLLLMNALPIAGLAVVAYRVRRGDATWGEVVPESVIVNGPYVAVAVVLLSLMVWVALPLIGAADQRVRDGLDGSAERRRNGGALRKLWELLLQPFRMLAVVLLWVATAVAWSGTFAALAGFALFLTRMAAPEWVDSWLPFSPPDPRDLLGGGG